MMIAPPVRYMLWGILSVAFADANALPVWRRCSMVWKMSFPVARTGRMRIEP
jgi:hypothetical protein